MMENKQEAKSDNVVEFEKYREKVPRALIWLKEQAIAAIVKAH